MSITDREISTKTALSIIIVLAIIVSTATLVLDNAVKNMLIGIIDIVPTVEEKELDGVEKFESEQ